ncbi:MAG TPA: hypothetical protein VFO76_11435 [Candidatus Kapabacteria bacterium]|nr:hypothetical protein [Candidatus Kapabacteria bacterium]
MKENTFTVDLGNIKLSDDQRIMINSAIQSAVSSELSKHNSRGRVALVPIDNWHLGPIINGIIARPINDKTFEGLLGGQL